MTFEQDNRNHVDELKQAMNPDNVAESLGLSGKGKRYYCPICQPNGGKTPDLSITEHGFHCFKCGMKGDLLTLIQDIGNMTFPEAVTWAEDMTGIQIKQSSPKNGRKRGLKGKASPSLRCAVNNNSRRTAPIKTDRSSKESKQGVTSDILTMFLDACDAVPVKALEWLEQKAVTPEAVESLRLRYCGRHYGDIMATLKRTFTEKDLLSAGLLKPSKKTGRPVPVFWHYYASKAGFLVIPYISDGKPVYLKARPPCSKATAERLKLSRFLNTPGRIPCLYNVDALKAEPKPDRVLICEGESDTWAAVSAGYTAVGSPGAKLFKPEWTRSFHGFSVPVNPDKFTERTRILEHENELTREEAEQIAMEETGQRSTVYLATDADPAGREGAKMTADIFRRAGLSVPFQLTLPEGADLCELLRCRQD